MGLDIYKHNHDSSQELIFTIDDCLYKEIEPALKLFQSITGIFIDPYGNTKFFSGLNPLLEVLDSFPNKSADFKELNLALKESEKDCNGLSFVGD